MCRFSRPSPEPPCVGGGFTRDQSFGCYYEGMDHAARGLEVLDLDSRGLSTPSGSVMVNPTPRVTSSEERPSPDEGK